MTDMSISSACLPASVTERRSITERNSGYKLAGPQDIQSNSDLHVPCARQPQARRLVLLGALFAWCLVLSLFGRSGPILVGALSPSIYEISPPFNPHNSGTVGCGWCATVIAECLL